MAKKSAKPHKKKKTKVEAVKIPSKYRWMLFGAFAGASVCLYFILV